MTTETPAGVEIAEKRDPDAVRRILTSLPDWFGDPEAIDHYVDASTDPSVVSLLAILGQDVVGVALLRRPFPETAELHLIAVTPSHLRAGIGTALLDRVASRCSSQGRSLLSVHTVGPFFDSAPYARTRAFYRASGFHPLEERTGLDWWGPTLILVRPLAAGSTSPE